MIYYKQKNLSICHGDCNEILQYIDTNVAGLFLTDPPFGINYQNNYCHDKLNKLQGDVNFFSYYNWSKEAYRISKKDTALFAFSCWSEYGHNCQEISQSGFLCKEPLIVQKRASGKTDLYGSFQSNSDWIIFATKGRFVFKKTNLIKNKKAGVIPNVGRKPVPEFKTRFPSCWFGDGFPFSTENPSLVRKFGHPTVKSVEFMKWLILLTTNEGDLIIDPFMGSGSVALAAIQTKRKFLGIEIEKKFCDLSIDRIRGIF